MSTICLLCPLPILEKFLVTWEIINLYLLMMIFHLSLSYAMKTIDFNYFYFFYNKVKNYLQKSHSLKRSILI